MGSRLDLASMDYNELQARYTPMMVKFLNKYPPIQGYSSEDLRQELCIVLYKAHEKFDHKRDVAKFTTYIYRAFRNRLMNLVRDKNKHDELNSIPDWYDEPIEDDTSFIDLVGHTSLLAQDVAFAIVNDEDYRDIFSEEEVDLAFTELEEVLRKGNE